MPDAAGVGFAPRRHRFAVPVHEADRGGDARRLDRRDHAARRRQIQRDRLLDQQVHPARRACSTSPLRAKGGMRDDQQVEPRHRSSRSRSVKAVAAMLARRKLASWRGRARSRRRVSCRSRSSASTARAARRCRRSRACRRAVMNASIAWSTPGSPCVEPLEQRRRVGERHGVGDQRQQIEHALVLQLDRGAPQPRLGPAVHRFGRDAGDLRADQFDAVVVELLAQPQPRDLALEEPHGHDARRIGDRADRFGERGAAPDTSMQTSAPRPPVIALIASAAPTASSAWCAPSFRAIARRAGSGSTPITRAPLARAACATIWPGTPSPNTATEIADPDPRVVHAVERDRADMAEDADARIGAVGHQPVARVVGRRRHDACGGSRCRRPAGRSAGRRHRAPISTISPTSS